MLGNYLEELVVVAREGSMTRAALALSLSQSSLSRHIASLESTLGVRLLDRGAGGATLTEDGRWVCRRAAGMLECEEDVVAYARSRRGRDAERGVRRVRVGGLFDFPSFLRVLKDAGAGRAERGEGRPLEVLSVEGNPPVRESLDLGACALYVTYDVDEELSGLGGELRVEPFAHPRVVAVMEASNPLAQKEGLRPADLEGQVLLSAESNYMRARTDWASSRRALQEAGVSFYAKPGVFTSEVDWYADFGRGVLLLPEGSRGVPLNVSLGKVAIPVEGLRHNLVAVWRDGDADAAWLASVDVDGALGLG